jgi:hypothetical protein
LEGDWCCWGGLAAVEQEVLDAAPGRDADEVALEQTQEVLGGGLGDGRLRGGDRPEVVRVLPAAVEEDDAPVSVAAFERCHGSSRVRLGVGVIYLHALRGEILGKPLVNARATPPQRIRGQKRRKFKVIHGIAT